ncbi:MAG: HDIG domain-containing protein [Euryarchaeota archaeon]|nr:HDIG domain-containing protein [Euryarchaeota archaeon]
MLHKAGCPPDVIAHARAVAECAREIAMQCNEKHQNHADIELVIIGTLPHDIGRARSNGIDHTVAGAEIAQALGLDARIARIIKRHIRAGIPKDEAERLGLPRADYLPFAEMNHANVGRTQKTRRGRQDRAAPLIGDEGVVVEGYHPPESQIL